MFSYAVLLISVKWIQWSFTFISGLFKGNIICVLTFNLQVARIKFRWLRSLNEHPQMGGNDYYYKTPIHKL